MIGRVKVTTSIERNVSLYTTPDKNTSNVKRVAFSDFDMRVECAFAILVQTAATLLC